MCELVTLWLYGVHAEVKKQLSFENAIWQAALCEVGAKAEGSAGIINSKCQLSLFMVSCLHLTVDHFRISCQNRNCDFIVFTCYFIKSKKPN